MLSSITPLGERGHGRLWHATATWYVAGSTAGGAAIGLLAGMLGAVLPVRASAAVMLGAAVCFAAGVTDALIRGRRLPSWRRQVNEDWLVGYRPWVVGGGFGVQLGAGVATVVTTASIYAMLALALLTGSAIAGAAVGATFGLARALPVLAARSATTPAALARLHATVAAWASRVRAATVALLAFGGLALLILGGV